MTGPERAKVLRAIRLLHADEEAGGDYYAGMNLLAELAGLPDHGRYLLAEATAVSVEEIAARPAIKLRNGDAGPSLSRELYRVDEVRWMLGIGRTTLYKAINDGTIPHVMIGGPKGTRIPAAWIRSLAASVPKSSDPEGAHSHEKTETQTQESQPRPSQKPAKSARRREPE